MTDEHNKILLLGLPETGKTSFLSAFLHYIDAPIDGKNLRQYKLSSNTTYVTAIVQDWLSGKKPERTKVTMTKNANTEANIYIEDQATGQKFTLHIPDFYGEIFENQFFDRQIEIEYIEQIKDSCGILLFIHPERINEPTLIEDVIVAHKFADLINANFETEETAVEKPLLSDDDNVDLSNETDLAQPFNIEESPTQLVLVDLLEAHLEYLSKLPMNLSLIISAWDVIQKDCPDLSPVKWVEKTLPLLYQFLLANNNKIKFKGFGISAVGGNIEDPIERQRLIGLDEPSERITVQDEDTINKNIASPIEWILKEWQKVVK